MSVTKRVQLLEKDGRHVLVTTTYVDGVEKKSYEIVPDTEDSFASAWNKVCGPESILRIEMPDSEIEDISATEFSDGRQR